MGLFQITPPNRLNGTFRKTSVKPHRGTAQYFVPLKGDNATDRASQPHRTKSLNSIARVFPLKYTKRKKAVCRWGRADTSGREQNKREWLLTTPLYTPPTRTGKSSKTLFARLEVTHNGRASSHRLYDKYPTPRKRTEIATKLQRFSPDIPYSLKVDKRRK